MARTDDISFVQFEFKDESRDKNFQDLPLSDNLPQNGLAVRIVILHIQLGTFNMNVIYPLLEQFMTLRIDLSNLLVEPI